MRRPDLLQWLLIVAMLLAAAALGQAVFVSANASLVHTLTASVTVSTAAPSTAPSDAAAAGGGAESARGTAGAVAAIDGMSSAMAEDIAAKLDRDATWLAMTIAALLAVLAAAAIVRSRQLPRARM